MAFQRKKLAAIGLKAKYPGFMIRRCRRLTGAERQALGQVRRLPGSSPSQDAAVKVFTRRGNDWTNRAL
jgi:hypothetical protein